MGGRAANRHGGVLLSGGHWEEPHSISRSPGCQWWGLESRGGALLQGRPQRHHRLGSGVHRAARRRENALTLSLLLLFLLQQVLHGCDAVLKCVSVALYIPLMIAETLAWIAAAKVYKKCVIIL